MDILINIKQNTLEVDSFLYVNNSNSEIMSASKKQNKNKKLEEQARLRAQRQLQQMRAYKQKLMPLVLFLKKHKLIFKHARVGQNRIQYFRLDEYTKFKQNNAQLINKNQKIKQLIEGVDIHDFFYFNRPQGMKNIKYPGQLQATAYSQQNLPKFCSFKFDSTGSRTTTVLLGILGIFALVLFPVWPYIVKYALWLISLYLLIFLVGLIVVRLFIYLFCVILGFNVWIFPNLLGEAGIIDSFKPFFYAQRWEKSTINIIIRIGAFLLLAYYGYQIYLDPTILEDSLNITKGTIQDVHDWGVSKIKNEVKFSERAISNLDQILNETADVADRNQDL